MNRKNPNVGKRKIRRAFLNRGSRPSEHTSECVSYKLDSDGNPVDAHIFRNKRSKRSTVSTATQIEAARRESRMKLLAIAGNASQVD